jgi:hypothetical protein
MAERKEEHAPTERGEPASSEQKKEPASLKRKEDPSSSEEIEARAELLKQFSGGGPTFSFGETVDWLERRFDAMRQLSWEDFSRQAAEDRELQDRALDFFLQILTPAGIGMVDPDADYDRPFELAKGTLVVMDEAHKRRFLETVLFDLMSSADYQFLKDAIRRAFPPDEMARAIAENLQSENELHVLNALHLPYFLFGWDPDYSLGKAQKEEIRRAVADLRGRERLNPLVKMGIESFALP